MNILYYLDLHFSFYLILNVDGRTYKQFDICDFFINMSNGKPTPPKQIGVDLPNSQSFHYH